MLERSWAGKRWEKGSVALERHYRLSPSCRPLSEITPATLAGLIIDLSDRLPYCAVVKKDLTMWQKFNTRATSCMSFKGAAAEALWLFKQLKDSVVNEEWVKTMPNGTQDFVAKCQKCSQKEEARDIIQELEFECIDWTQVCRAAMCHRGSGFVIWPLLWRTDTEHAGHPLAHRCTSFGPKSVPVNRSREVVLCTVHTCSCAYLGLCAKRRASA